MERERGIIEKTAGISKKIDLLQIVAGLAIGSTGLAALGVLGYMVGDHIENLAEKRSKNN